MTYCDASGSQAGQGASPAAKGASRTGPSLWRAGVLAFVLLIGAGVAYQAVAQWLNRMRESLELQMHLSTIPKHIGSWDGNDVLLQPSIVEYIKQNYADDYVNREYRNKVEGAWAGVYVVYCSTRPSGLIGHKPDACFPANGWIRDSTTKSDVITRSGRKIQCLLQQFHKAPPAYEQVSVLSFYVLNGQITLQERDFSGFLGRTPNISGNPARYVAQVQISSAFERSARSAATDLVDTILTFLPGRDVGANR